MDLRKLEQRELEKYWQGRSAYVNASGRSLDEVVQTLRANYARLGVHLDGDQETMFRRGWADARADMDIELALTLTRESADDGD